MAFIVICVGQHTQWSFELPGLCKMCKCFDTACTDQQFWECIIGLNVGVSNQSTWTQDRHNSKTKTDFSPLQYFLDIVYEVVNLKYQFGWEIMFVNIDFKGSNT